jgi:hypothetical protein
MDAVRTPYYHYTLVIGFICIVVVGQALASEFTLPYGSRAGMDVTITKRSGIGTNNASIAIRHTPANAKSFCVNYEMDYSKACVTRTMEEIRVKKTVTANCATGQFTDVWGQAFILKGRSQSSGTDFEILDLAQGMVLDETMASGYSIQLSIISALCPNLIH